MFKSIENSLDDSGEFWKKYKYFSENKMPNSSVDDNITSSKWKNHFETLHTENRNQNIPSFVENKPTKSLNKQFKMKELVAVISKMKNKKAEGIDKIANEMLKHLPENLLVILLEIFNCFLKNGKIPKSWCEGLITPILKSGKSDDPDNYRGICISNALLKCLCSMLNNRLKKFCAKFNLIAKEQIGFREKSRTTDHLFTLKTVISKHLNEKKGNKVYSCFIDLRKAYDSIHHEALFYKLKKANINSLYLDLIRDIYAKTSCAVKVNGKCTEFFNYSKGVRQGCPLSPLLFNIFIDGVVKKLDKTNPTPLNLDKNLSCLLYADDLVILSATKDGLQKCLDAAESFFTKWNLDINCDKTKCMTFDKRGKIEKHAFTIKNCTIKNVNSFKYLGLTVSSKNCSFAKTISDLGTKASRALFGLKTNLNLLKMPIKLLLKLFDTMIAPILLYGTEVWLASGKFTFNNWDKTDIERVQTSLLKQYLGVNRSTQNNMIRSEFGRLPLIINAHNRVWNFTKYLNKKPTETLAKNAYDIDSSFNNEISLYQNCNKTYRDIITKNIKKGNDPINTGKQKVKNFFKNNYIDWWKNEIRNASTSASFAMHKNTYDLEAYIEAISIKKHRNALAKLRLSDHKLKIQSGRQTRPITPRELRRCSFCPQFVEDEAHFLFECTDGQDLKSIFYNNLISTFPDINDMNNKQMKYKALMKIQDPDLLKSLGYLVHKLFAKRD